MVAFRAAKRYSKCMKNAMTRLIETVAAKNIATITYIKDGREVTERNCVAYVAADGTVRINALTFTDVRDFAMVTYRSVEFISNNTGYTICW